MRLSGGSSQAESIMGGFRRRNGGVLGEEMRGFQKKKWGGGAGEEI